MAFSKLRNLAVKASSLISECGLSQSRRHSSTKYSRQVPRISLKDEVAGRREYCEVAQFAASSNESFAPSSSINVKGEKKKYTSYDLRKMGLKGILNYSVEDAEDNAACDANLKHFLGIVSSISLFPPQSETFVSLKLSAICTPELLQRVSQLLRWQHRHPDFNLTWKEEVLPLLAPSSPYHDDCASFLLQKVATGEAALLLATHNLESVNTAIAKSEELDIVESKGMVQLAQLKGMSDLLSLGIQNAVFQVSKCLPFGTVENVIPYLMRRAEQQEIMLGEKIRGACKMYLSTRVPTRGDRLEMTYIGSEEDEDDTSKSDEEDEEDDSSESDKEDEEDEDKEDEEDEDNTSEDEDDDTSEEDEDNTPGKEEDDYHDEEDENDTPEDDSDIPKDDDHHGNHTSHDDGNPKDDNTSQNHKYSTEQSTVSVHNLDEYLSQHKEEVDAILKRFYVETILKGFR